MLHCLCLSLQLIVLHRDVRETWRARYWSTLKVTAMTIIGVKIHCNVFWIIKVHMMNKLKGEQSITSTACIIANRSKSQGYTRNLKLNTVMYPNRRYCKLGSLERCASLDSLWTQTFNTLPRKSMKKPVLRFFNLNGMVSVKQCREKGHVW